MDGGDCGEETWALLPDDSVMAVEVLWGANGPNSAQRYLPATDEWVFAGATLDPLIAGAAEIGPALLLPNGQYFQVGASGFTALYDPPTGVWSTGPAFPLGPAYNQEFQGYPNLTACDAPGVLQPNGKVICVAGPYDQNTGFSTPTTFFEFDPTTFDSAVGGFMPQLAEQPPAGSASGPTFVAILLPLPSGDILFCSGQPGLWLYTPDPSDQPNAAWQPVITSAPASVTPGDSYTLEGQQFNGLSQAASYGDDAQMATNYPIVRIQNILSGNVFYCRTHDHSTMGVATGASIVSTQFDVPATIDPGDSQLFVIANGIASNPVSLAVEEYFPPKLDLKVEVKPFDKPGEKVAILEFKPKDRDAHGGGLGTGAPWLQTGGGEFLDEVEPGADDVDPTEAGALRKGFIRPEERPDEAAPPATPTNEED